MVFCPIWAGSGLHDLIVRNLEKLADSLDDVSANTSKMIKLSLAMRKILVRECKATNVCLILRQLKKSWPILQDGNLCMADSTFNIHGNNTSRLAYQRAPDYLKKHLSDVCMVLSTNSSEVLKDLLTVLIWNHHEDIKHIDTVKEYAHGSDHYIVEVDIVLPPDMVLRETHDIGETLQVKLEQLPEVERAF
ncbi:metal tolerance protein 10, partial [Quercus suber]